MHSTRRWLVLIAVLCSWSILTWIFGTLLAVALTMSWSKGDHGLSTFSGVLSSWLDNQNYWVSVFILVPVMIGTQVLFVLPVAPVTMTPGKPRSLRTSIILAGLGAAMLTMGLALGLMSLVQLLFGWLDEVGVALYSGVDGIAVLEANLYDEPGFLIPLACLLVSWVLWSIAIAAFMRRGQPLDRFHRLTGLLFAGTLIELVLILPLEAMVRRKADCNCTTGSFQSLLGGFTAALWLLGPTAFLVLLRRRSSWWARHCQRCGYEKAPGAVDRCPECGNEWG